MIINLKILYLKILVFACWVIFHTFVKKSFRNTIRVSNGLDPDEDQYSVSPDLEPQCLQRLSADDKSPLAWKEFKNS